MILTFQYRLKDSSVRNDLKKRAGQVNFVWNFANEVIRRRWSESRFYTSENDLHALTKGSSKLLDIPAQTVQAVAYECLSKVRVTRGRVRYRSGKKNLGWIPFTGQSIKFKETEIYYYGLDLPIWKHRDLPQGHVIKSGSFNQDARGRWYVNLICQIPDSSYFLEPSPEGTEIGIDPGTKTILTTSEGEKFERPNFIKLYAERLAKAQKYGKKKIAKTIHAKMKNSRKDFNHKSTTTLASRYQLIYFGNASSEKLVKTRMAKGILDASWHEIKIFLSYKTLRRGGKMLIIDERNSTVTCSCCLQKTGPSGLSGLSIREWECDNCKALLDRDINASINILRFGRETLSLKRNI